MTKLSPCPVCGAKAKLAAGPVAGTQTWETYIECTSCHARSPKLDFILEGAADTLATTFLVLLGIPALGLVVLATIGLISSG